MNLLKREEPSAQIEEVGDLADGVEKLRVDAAKDESDDEDSKIEEI